MDIDASDFSLTETKACEIREASSTSPSCASLKKLCMVSDSTSFPEKYESELAKCENEL